MNVLWQDTVGIISGHASDVRNGASICPAPFVIVTHK